MESREQWLSVEEVRKYQGPQAMSHFDRSQSPLRSQSQGYTYSSALQSECTPGRNEQNGMLSNIRRGLGLAPSQIFVPPPSFPCHECKERFAALDDLEVHKLTAHHKQATATPPSYGTFLYSKAQPVTELQSACLAESRIGKFRGIQGENNSCYLDSALMAMFYANGTYDGLLAAPREPALGATTMGQDVEYARLFLTMHIVNNLRRRGYVPSMLVLEWRRMISPWFGAGMDFDSHCAEEEACEFVGFLLKAFGEGVESTKFILVPREAAGSPTAKRKSLLTNQRPLPMPEAQAMLQLLPPPAESGSQKFIWNMETLVNYTLQSERLRFAELNSSLILQLPRYGKRDRVIGAVAPDPCLALCYGLSKEKTKALFELRALVVIGTSHFVTYLRVKNPNTRTSDDSYETSCTGVEVTETTTIPVVPHRYSWLYYDSMNDRDDHQNIPVIDDVTAELSILELPNAAALVAQQLIESAAMSPHLKRVVEDMSLAFYARVG